MSGIKHKITLSNYKNPVLEIKTIIGNTDEYSQFHGKCEIYWNNSSYYKGYLNHGIFHGKCEHYIFGKFKYLGSYKSGKKNNHGEMHDYYNDSHYIGNWYNDFYSQYGILTEKDDENKIYSIYKGNFIQGYKHGYGEYQISNESYYKGYFSHGQYEGYGVLTCEIPYKNNMYFTEFYKYEGNFYENLKENQGTLTCLTTGNKITGNFGYDNPCGYCVLETTEMIISGLCYNYEFYSDCKIKYLKTGDFYEGEVLNNIPHNYGTLITGNNKYIGNFNNGKKHGKGILYSSVKYEVTYIGSWLNDKKHGSFTVITSNICSEVIYLNDLKLDLKLAMY